MQPTSIRRRVPAAAPLAQVAGPAFHELPIVRLIMNNGIVEFEDPVTAVRMMENEQRARLAAEAEQAALSVVYRLSGEPDDSRPFGGLLTRRLDISERTARALITEGRIKYTCLGTKGYRVTELAVRMLLGDKMPT